jgi:hypothetical protein
MLDRMMFCGIPHLSFIDSKLMMSDMAFSKKQKGIYLGEKLPFKIINIF